MKEFVKFAIDEFGIMLLMLGIFSIILIIFVVVVRKYYYIHLENYKKIYIGMSEEEMIYIMGNRYNKSSLKGNRFKYEWRMNTLGGGYYSNIRKVDIYIKDGEVEEIYPYNV